MSNSSKESSNLYSYVHTSVCTQGHTYIYTHTYMHISVQTVSSHTCIFGHVWVCTHILFFQACVHTNRYESGPKIVVEVEVASVLRSKTVFNKNWRNGVPNSNTALTGDLGQEGGLWPDRLVRLGPGMGGPPSLPPPLGQESAGKGGGDSQYDSGERKTVPTCCPPQNLHNQNGGPNHAGLQPIPDCNGKQRRGPEEVTGR